MDARSASLADAFLGGGTDPASTQTRPLDRIHKIQRAGDDPVELRLTVYSYSCRGQELLTGTMLMLAAVATVF